MKNKISYIAIYILILFFCIEPVVSIVIAYEAVNIYSDSKEEKNNQVNIYEDFSKTKDIDKDTDNKTYVEEKDIADDKNKDDVTIYKDSAINVDNIVQSNTNNTSDIKDNALDTVLSSSKRIDMTNKKLVDEYAKELKSPISVLFDEQELLPIIPEMIKKEVSIKLTGKPQWHPGESSSGVSAYIDLKGIYKITEIAYFDVNGVTDLKFSTGKPFSWNNFKTITTSSFNEWNVVNVNADETRYLRIETLSGGSSGISELAIYGYKVSDIENEDKKEDITNPNFNITVDKAIGANAFIDDPMHVLDALGVVREYHNFHWTLDRENENKFNPSYGGQWNFDEYYKKLYERGIVIMPCIQAVSRAVLGVGNTNNKPVKKGADTKDPASYKIHASTMFQYAARYGKTKVEDSNLLLAKDQSRVSGLGYITYYENWNEQDKTWEGDASYFHPYEFAAMTSADYDGHEGKLGNTYGVKNADKNAKLVMGGLAGGERTPRYLDLMKSWFENNREDKKMAFDVINFHTYAGNKSPEESNFKKIVSDVAKWRNINARDKEVWLTEYGWDSTVTSPIAAPSNETARDWLVRSSIIALASGIDRVTMYMSRDASWVGNPGKYGTSGLTTEKGAWDKKPSWYGMYTVKEVLKDYTFDSVVKETDNIYMYKFVNKKTNDITYAIWSPTSNGSYIKDYEIEVGIRTKPVITKLVDGYYDGLKEKLVISNSKIKIDVTESPVFVTLSAPEGKYISPTNTLINVTPEMVSTKDLGQSIENLKLIKNFKNMFDEQSKIQKTPLMKNTASFTTSFESNVDGKHYPLEGYIDFGEEQYISHVGIYDFTALGNIEFYAGEPNNWSETPFYSYDLSSYKNFVVNSTNIKTRYVKIVKKDSAVLNEIAFYGYSIKSDKFDPNEELNKNSKELKELKERLKSKIEELEKMDKSKYTEESILKFNKKVETSKEVLSTKDVSKQALQKSYEELLKSPNILVTKEDKLKEEIELIKNKILEKIKEYEKTKSIYTEESIKKINSTLNKIGKILRKIDATKEELNKEYEELLNLKNKLITIESAEKQELDEVKKILKSKIEEYEKIDKTKYTTDSLKYFEYATLLSKQVLIKENAKKEEITEKYNLLKTSFEQLVKKEEKQDEKQEEQINKDTLNNEKSKEIKKENQNENIEKSENNVSEKENKEEAKENKQTETKEKNKEDRKEPTDKKITEEVQVDLNSYKVLPIVMITVGGITFIFSLVLLILNSRKNS